MGEASKRDLLRSSASCGGLKATHSQRSVSAIVNEAVRAALAEDQEDLAAFRHRATEPTLKMNDLRAQTR